MKGTKFTLLENHQCVHISKPPLTYRISDFADYIGANKYTTPFQAFMKRAGYRVSKNTKKLITSNNTCIDFGIKNEGAILRHVSDIVGEEILQTQKVVKSNHLYGKVDGVSEASIFEIKTRSSFATISDQELAAKKKNFFPDPNSFWQSAIYAYVLGKKFFVIAYFFPTLLDYKNGFPNSLENRLIIRRYNTKVHLQLIKKGLSTFNKFVDRMDQGFTPCFNPKDPGDMRIVASILSNIENQNYI